MGLMPCVRWGALPRGGRTIAALTLVAATHGGFAPIEITRPSRVVAPLRATSPVTPLPGGCNTWGMVGAFVGRFLGAFNRGDRRQLRAFFPARPSPFLLRLAALMTAPSGAPRRSVSTWRLVPRLPRLVGSGPVSSPPRGGRHRRAVRRLPVPPDASLRVVAGQLVRPESLPVPSATHSWKRRWHVDPEPNSVGVAFHWQPVRSTYRMPSSTRRSGTTARPGVPGAFSGGRRPRHSSHNSSGMRQVVGSASGSSWLVIVRPALLRAPAYPVPVLG